MAVGNNADISPFFAQLYCPDYFPFAYISRESFKNIVHNHNQSIDFDTNIDAIQTVCSFESTKWYIILPHVYDYATINSA